MSFEWNSTSRNSRKGKRDIGLIAQEVEKILPEVVSETTLDVGDFAKNETHVKTVNYGQIVAVLIEDIKQQQQQINKLTEK